MLARAATFRPWSRVKPKARGGSTWWPDSWLCRRASAGQLPPLCGARGGRHEWQRFSTAIGTALRQLPSRALLDVTYRGQRFRVAFIVARAGGRLGVPRSACLGSRLTPQQPAWRASGAPATGQPTSARPDAQAWHASLARTGAFADAIVHACWSPHAHWPISRPIQGENETGYRMHPRGPPANRVNCTTPARPPRQSPMSLGPCGFIVPTAPPPPPCAVG